MTALLPYILLALIAGSAFPIQAGVNSRLSQWTQSPVLASAISFTVGALALNLLTAVMRVPLPPLSSLSAQPWWMWIGGLLGAVAVFSAIVLAPRLGAASMLALILSGQMLASLAMDQYGMLGYPVRPITLPKLVGGALVIGGIALIQFNRSG